MGALTKLLSNLETSTLKHIFNALNAGKILAPRYFRGKTVRILDLKFLILILIIG